MSSIDESEWPKVRISASASASVCGS
jgi:hypothetical protein